MKMKKIIAICLLLLLIAMPNSIGKEGSTNETLQNNQDSSIILTSIQSDGSSTTEEIIASEKEIVTLQNTLSTLIKKASFVKNWQRLQDIIINLVNNNPILSKIFKPFIKFRPLLNRALVLSLGHNFKFNPFKNNFKIRKKINFWHYSSGKLIKDRTVIFKPLALKLKILSGVQFGFMTRFIGIYIFIPRKLPEKSFTFFMGTARHIKGFQIFPSI